MNPSLRASNLFKSSTLRQRRSKLIYVTVAALRGLNRETHTTPRLFGSSDDGSYNCCNDYYYVHATQLIAWPSRGYESTHEKARHRETIIMCIRFYDRNGKTSHARCTSEKSPIIPSSSVPAATRR